MAGVKKPPKQDNTVLSEEGLVIKKFAVGALEPWERNPRTITAVAFQGLRESLREFGMLEMPVVNIRGGKKRLVSGHQRVSALIAEGYTEVDCLVVDLDDTDEQAANLAMNNRHIRGKWDIKALVPTLNEIMVDLPRPDYAGFSAIQDQIRKVSELRGKSKAADKKVTDATVDPESERGAVYQLGVHRLLCGDCVNDRPSKWLKGAKIDACITDPPYNVAYDAGGSREKIVNDKMSDVDFRVFLEGLCQFMLKTIKGPCHIFMSGKALSLLQHAWEQSGGVVYRWLVWEKNMPVYMPFRRPDYSLQVEWIMFCGRDDTPPNLKNAQTNIIQHRKPRNSPLHPTQKPLSMFKDILENSTSVGDSILEPFAGSGTTLIACEELDRVCYASEIVPHYCDVIRKRWAEQIHGVGCDWAIHTPVL